MTYPVLNVRFFRTSNSHEPVRDWLRSLSGSDKKIIGFGIRTVQYGWPIGMPIVRKVKKDLWELRVQLPDRIARVFFTVVEDKMVLLHGFIKKSRAIPQDELNIAEARMKKIQT